MAGIFEGALQGIGQISFTKPVFFDVFNSLRIIDLNSMGYFKKS